MFAAGVARHAILPQDRRYIGGEAGRRRSRNGFLRLDSKACSRGSGSDQAASDRETDASNYAKCGRARTIQLQISNSPQCRNRRQSEKPSSQAPMISVVKHELFSGQQRPGHVDKRRQARILRACDFPAFSRSKFTQERRTLTIRWVPAE